MEQEPDATELEVALQLAARQVLQHLGLTGPDYSNLITEAELARLSAVKQALEPQRKPWDYAYGAACEFLYGACQDSTTGAGLLAYRWLRGYFVTWFKGKLNDDLLTAEDLAGDVIEIIVRKLDRVRFPTAFLAWTEQIALNHFKDYLSKKDRYPPGQAPWDPSGHEGSGKPLQKVGEEKARYLAGGTNPEEVALERELRAKLIQCILAIPANTRNGHYYRRIITGFYFENKTIEELSELLGLPKIKITKLKSQALLKLRKIWEKLENPD
ncbi:MAG: hypothetical protein JWP00_182 [Chloroflexi bacterium]|nr:hypothetical protein [Chloroflexota bacterium]